MLKVCPNLYTEFLYKDGETYWFQAFKEISILLLADHEADRAETSIVTYNNSTDITEFI